MAEKSIILYQHEVQAISANRQSRITRVIKPQPPSFAEIPYQAGGLWYFHYSLHPPSMSEPFKSPYQVGDLLWVREKWLACEVDEIGYQYCVFTDEIKDGVPEPKELRFVGIEGDRKIYKWGWHPGIHMPKWAARFWVLVTKVGVEKSDKGIWEWVYEFEVKKNEDSILIS